MKSKAHNVELQRAHNVAFQVDVDVKGIAIAGGDAIVEFDPIGIGNPLKVELVSVYVGQTERESGQLLVMSTVRDPDAPAGAVFAMNWWGEGVESQEFVALNNGTGNRVIYYSPAESATLLSISVKLKFDYFPEDVVEAWAKAATNIVRLPILIGGLAVGGPVGAASAQAIVGVVGAGADLTIALLDERIDGTELTSMDWALSIFDPGFPVQKAGFVLLTEENLVAKSGTENRMASGYTSSQGPANARSGPKKFMEVKGNDFYVDARHQVLRHAKSGEWDGDGWTFKAGDEVRGPWPYVLVKAHGAKNDDLKKWKPAAVTADLAAKFLNRDRDAKLPDLTEKVFTAYSDMAMLDRAVDLQKQIVNEKVDSKAKLLLTKQYDAILDSIQNENLKESVIKKA
ncbi:hypothetical protein [Arthrobacter sp. HLT1-20]